jgi:ribonuclease HI
MAMKHLCPDLDLDATETIVFESISDIFLVPVPVKSFTGNVNLGSTKTRTKEQAILARKLAQDYLISLKEDIIAFTDGSALGNPGPCGSGVVVFWKGLGHDYTSHSRPISPKSTSYHAELGAVDLTFDVIDSSIHSKPIHIITDCKSALAASSSSNVCKNHTDLQMSIWRKHQPFVSNNTPVDITWVAGHIDLLGNDLADCTAKLAAKQAQSAPDSCSHPLLSPAEVSTITRAGIQSVWKKRWNDSCKAGCNLENLLPHSVSLTQCKSLIHRKAEIKINRLRLGHHKLKDRLHRIMPHAIPSPECECGNGRQTAEHVILHCNKYEKEREILIDKIERCYQSHSVPLHQRKLNIHTLLAPSFKEITNAQIQLAMAAYITAIALEI